MKCAKFRKFLFAFADGQLSVQANCDVLDHLKMCPACSRIVQEHQSLRAALRKDAETVQTPRGLDHRIRMILEKGGSPARSRGWRRGFRWKSLAVAASLMLALTIAWQKGLLTGTGGINNVPAGNNAASLVVHRHNECSAGFATHQDERLPTDPDEIGSATRELLGNRVAAVCPDLTPFGYFFESAALCSVNPSADPAAHILYVNDDGTARLSFFSTSRWDDIDHCSQGSIAFADDYRCYRVPQCNNIGSNLSVLAWHRGQTTYLCCGPMDLPSLRKIVDEVRVSIEQADASLRLAAQ